MAAPTLDSDHPGLKVVADVAAVLADGLASEEALGRAIAAMRRGLALTRCRLWLRTPDGASFSLLTTPGDEAHLPGVAPTELSQDLASEVALRTREVEAQRNFAARIIDSLPVGLYVIDRSYVIRAWNRKRESGTQGVAREDAVGREIFEVLDRQPRELLKREFDRVFDTGELQQVEMESAATGEPRYYRITKIPMRLDEAHISHVITIGEDITDWRLAQKRLGQTEKLAAVGQLAAGVMHEINNPLATILACAEALALRTAALTAADKQAAAEYLKIIDTEVQRCRGIVDALLDFSRPKQGAKRPVAINDVLEQTLFLLKHHERFKRLTVARELTEGLPVMAADAEP